MTRMSKRQALITKDERETLHLCQKGFGLGQRAHRMNWRERGKKKGNNHLLADWGGCVRASSFNAWLASILDLVLLLLLFPIWWWWCNCCYMMVVSEQLPKEDLLRFFATGAARRRMSPPPPPCSRLIVLIVESFFSMLIPCGTNSGVQAAHQPWESTNTTSMSVDWWSGKRRSL